MMNCKYLRNDKVVEKRGVWAVLRRTAVNGGAISGHSVRLRPSGADLAPEGRCADVPSACSSVGAKQSFSDIYRGAGQARYWLIALTCFLTLISCQQTDDSWQRIQAEGLLRVGLDPTYPPFEVAQGDDVQGLDVDLMNMVAADLGLEATFVYFGYDGLYDALATGQVDVLASALVIVPEQARDFAYTKPYFNAGEILIVPLEDEEIGEMRDLNGRFLAVELGALSHVEATQWEKKLTDLTILSFPSTDEALTAVAQGQADAALVDNISGRLYLSNHPSQLKRIPIPITVEPYALVVREGDTQLLKTLNNSLKKLDQAGQLNLIIEKWLGK